ncbi:MAG: TraR/DksA family transcriptional regulator [Gemmatimonadaceae bacterium]
MPHTHTLTETQLKGLRSDMERQLARLLQSVRAHEGEDPTGADSTDVGGVLKGRRQEQLAVVVAALQRVDAGEYGDCGICGTRIPYGRLAVMPETPLCIACGAR